MVNFFFINLFSAEKSTYRSDPYRTAYNWREELDFDLMKAVDKSCTDVYTHLGYVTFQSEADMRNFSIPPKLTTFGKGRLVLNVM